MAGAFIHDPFVKPLYNISSSKISFITVHICELTGKDYYSIHFTNGRVKLLKEF